MEKINLILEEVHKVTSNFASGSGRISQLCVSLGESVSSFSTKSGLPFAGALTLVALVRKLYGLFVAGKEGKKD